MSEPTTKPLSAEELEEAEFNVDIIDGHGYPFTAQLLRRLVYQVRDLERQVTEMLPHYRP